MNSGSGRVTRRLCGRVAAVGADGGEQCRRRNGGPVRALQVCGWSAGADMLTSAGSQDRRRLEDQRGAGVR